MMEKTSLFITYLMVATKLLMTHPTLKPSFGETSVSLKHPILEAGVIILPTQTIHHYDGNPLKITINLYEID